MLFQANGTRLLLEAGATADVHHAEMRGDGAADESAGGRHVIHCFST